MESIRYPVDIDILIERTMWIACHILAWRNSTEVCKQKQIGALWYKRWYNVDSLLLLEQTSIEIVWTIIKNVYTTYIYSY